MGYVKKPHSNEQLRSLEAIAVAKSNERTVIAELQKQYREQIRRETANLRATTNGLILEAVEVLGITQTDVSQEGLGIPTSRVEVKQRLDEARVMAAHAQRAVKLDNSEGCLVVRGDDLNSWIVQLSEFPLDSAGKAPVTGTVTYSDAGAVLEPGPLQGNPLAVVKLWTSLQVQSQVVALRNG